MHPAVIAWLASVLPTPISRIADRSWPDGRSAVYQLRDGRDAEWFVKHHRDGERRGSSHWRAVTNATSIDLQ
jgi:hypothetical protein